MRCINTSKIYSSVLITAALVGMSSSAIAQDPDFMVVYDTGWACPGFALKIEGWFGGANYRVFKETNGYVRSLQAGRGESLRFTNLATGKTMLTDSRGAAWHTTTYTPDGSARMEATGHTSIVWWPTDLTPGPSTILYTGRVSVTINSAGQLKLESASGRTIDVCAAIS